MIKTIIFDLGKVLIPFDFKRGYEALQAHCAYPAAEIPKRIATSDLVQRLETGLVEPEDFVKQLSQLLDLRISHQQFCEIWSSIFAPDTLIPESMVEALRQRYRVMLLSNTNRIHYEMIKERYPILNHFDEYILSYEVKAMKPQREIFDAALRRAQCEPQECFYTDDILAYVEATQQLGIDAVQFESRPQLERELKARGVEW